MVGIAIEEGGQKAEEFALLDDLGLFGKYWRPKGREGDTLKLNKPVEVVSTKGSWLYHFERPFLLEKDITNF